MAEMTGERPRRTGGNGLAELWHLTRARVVLFWREPEAVFWVIVFPLVLAMVLGWAFTYRGPMPEQIGVLAGDHAELVQTLRGNPLLRVRVFEKPEEAETDLRFGRIAVLVVPGDPPSLRYDSQRPEAEFARLRVEQSLAAAPPLAASEVSASGVRYVDWLFPGLLGMNLMGTGLWGVGFAIVDMRQKRLLRRFLVTPMRRGSLLAAFLLSRGVFLIVEVAVLLLFALLVLRVPFNGDFGPFALTCALGAATFAALGMVIAARPRTLEGASGLMNFVMMPMWLFSGVFFSYERFPDAIQPVLRVLPLTALNDALRGVMLESRPLLELAPELGVLGIWLALCCLLVLRFFRWD